MYTSLAIVTLFSLIVVSSTRNVTVTTGIGAIMGKTENVSFAGTPLVVTQFLGIPYAEPPVGARRFRKPEVKAAFNETFIAHNMSPMCFQNLDYYGNLLNATINPSRVRESEDCLHLNIYLPGDGDVDTSRKRAVMIWIYGGGFQFGFQGQYRALAFPALNDVILVTMNYRLSVLGFLSSGDSTMPGNYGLWDQQMAIRWVHDNIEYFGGDTMNITIFGESAGATSVVYQAFYEGNKGLFRRVIAESGTADLGLSLERNGNMRTGFNNFSNRFGCSSEIAAIKAECLRKLPFNDYVTKTKRGDTFYPVFDQDFIKVKPADIISQNSTSGQDILKMFGQLDIILGVNSAEGAALLDLVEREIRARNLDPSTGYTLEMFEQIVIPFMLSNERKSKSDTLTQSIINQYVDWSHPKDTKAMRLNAVDFMSDIMFNADVVSTANAHATVKESGHTYFYVYDHQFSRVPARWYTGANHAEEVELVLGFPSNYMFIDGRPFTDHITGLPTEEITLSRGLMEFWTNFAKTGYVLFSIGLIHFLLLT